MTAWTTEELTRIGTAEELEIATFRCDDTPGSPRTIWVVPHGDDLHVRSVNAPTSACRGTRARHERHIRAAGADREVTFVDAAPDINDELDVVYRDKYRRYSPDMLDRITCPAARSTTIEVHGYAKQGSGYGSVCDTAEGDRPRHGRQLDLLRLPFLGFERWSQVTRRPLRA